MGLKTAKKIADGLKEEYNVEQWLHLDHCKDVELIKKCLDEGFDSVMIDASDKSFKENIEITRKVVVLAEEYGVNVEAELGSVPLPGNYDENKNLTIPAEAKQFVLATGVSSLAVAIGSKHGFYKEEAKLDIPRLQLIRELTDAFLVLHGGSGIPAEMLMSAIHNGICKINIATETKDIFIKKVKELLNNNDEIDLRKIFPKAITEIQKMIEQKLEIASGYRVEN
jgi:fructose-bisphosphate aldolase class II/tagatose 1,6-diphosphate aldolase GatY/KbaY